MISIKGEEKSKQNHKRSFLKKFLKILNELYILTQIFSHSELKFSIIITIDFKILTKKCMLEIPRSSLEGIVNTYLCLVFFKNLQKYKPANVFTI
jgi:hypothetical protein